MPVKRIGRRYLRFSVEGSKKFTEEEVYDAVQKGVVYLYGVLGLSQIEPVLIGFDEDEQRGILRCNRSHLREMRASLSFITSLAGFPAVFHVLRVSGTIKALMSKETTPG